MSDPIGPVVVIIRTNAGEDILAILCEDKGEVVKVEHPYFVKTVPNSPTVAMVPFCALSDEKYFEIRRNDMMFLVTANRDIATKFFNMVDALEVSQTRDLLDFEEPHDQLEAALLDKTYLPGNDTKH